MKLLSIPRVELRFLNHLFYRYSSGTSYEGILRPIIALCFIKTNGRLVIFRKQKADLRLSGP
jgi:hypothetical protein